MVLLLFCSVIHTAAQSVSSSSHVHRARRIGKCMEVPAARSINIMLLRSSDQWKGGWGEAYADNIEWRLAKACCRKTVSGSSKQQQQPAAA